MSTPQNKSQSHGQSSQQGQSSSQSGSQRTGSSQGNQGPVLIVSSSDSAFSNSPEGKATGLMWSGRAHTRDGKQVELQLFENEGASKAAQSAMQGSIQEAYRLDPAAASSIPFTSSQSGQSGQSGKNPSSNQA